jgi:predicted transcriptional regulator
MKAISINLTDEQAAVLERAAHGLKASKSALIREALNNIDLFVIGSRRLEKLGALAADSGSRTSTTAHRRTLANSERATDRSRTRTLTTRTTT